MSLPQERWQQPETTEDVINVTGICDHTGFQSETRP